MRSVVAVVLASAVGLACVPSPLYRALPASVASDVGQIDVLTTDQYDTPFPGVVVALLGPDLQVLKRNISDGDGITTFKALLAPSQYLLVATLGDCDMVTAPTLVKPGMSVHPRLKVKCPPPPI